MGFLGKGMSLLFNMLSKLVMAFLPRSKRLLISWQQSPSAVILEPKNINNPEKKKRAEGITLPGFDYTINTN